MSKRFENKIVAITGGSTGIGLATAIKFASEGAKVVIGSRNEKTGKAAVDKIKNLGGIASFIKTDVAKEEDVKVFVDYTISTYGGLNIAFNNGGTEGKTAAITNDTAENYQNIFDINVKGVFLSMKYQIQYMLENGGGSIVNTASIAGLIGFPEHGLYTASKHAVLVLCQSEIIG